MKKDWGRTITLSVILFFIGWACAVTIPSLSDEQTRIASQQWPDVTVESLSKGRDLYIRHCAGCHSLHSPIEYSSARWPKVVAEMSRKARLHGEDSLLVLRYLQSASLTATEGR